nr:hypothetical protein [Tanacetum cinerariifolium]
MNFTITSLPKDLKTCAFPEVVLKSIKECVGNHFWVEHAPPSPAHTPKYSPPADDDLELVEVQELPAPISPAYLSSDYSADSELIEDDPQEATDDPNEDKLLALAASTPAIADLASPSEETEPFEEDEVTPTLLSPLSPLSAPLLRIPSPTSHSITLFSYIRLRKAFEIRESSATAAARQPGSTLPKSISMDMIKTLQHQRQDDDDRVTRLIGHVRELERFKELKR